MVLNQIYSYFIRLLNKIFSILNYGYRIKIISENTKEILIPYDMDKEFLSIYEKSKLFTMTSIERMFALYKSLIYITEREIVGDIVECGVWKGGSMMLCALTLLKLKDTRRTLYLYDTYEGMTMPTRDDIRASDNFDARIKWNELTEKSMKWDFSPLEEVKKNLYSTGYPKKNIIFVKGKVEDSIPNTKPEKISILRLDTDWFESTYHELIHLYPNLVEKGILILDDYGHWKGAKKAVDKYFDENNIKLLKNRVDKTGRLIIKY